MYDVAHEAPFAAQNAYLVGMAVHHASLGAGLITQTCNDGGEYCDVVFAASATPLRYRIDLLNGWGGYFADKTAEIDARRAAWKSRRTVAEPAKFMRWIDQPQYTALRAEDGSLQSAIAACQRQDAGAMQTILHEQGISHLLHFTRSENLEHILRNGILPRADLVAGSFVANDDLREDRFPEASCLSIGFPNYKMFYKYRCDAPADCAGWAVLAIAPALLLEQSCLFYKTNAAAHESRWQASADATELMGASALQAMFAEPTHGLRAALRLTRDCSTDPQAEVLAFGRIAPERFVGVALSLNRARLEVENQVRDVLPALPILRGTGWFDCRHDHAFWKGRRITELSERDY